MARLTIGNDAVFEAMRPTNYTAQVYDFVNDQVNKYQQFFGGVQNCITDRIQQWQTAYVNTDAARVGMALVRQFQSHFAPESIRPLSDIWELQNAPTEMMRGIMAMPEARKLANKQMCNAYQGNYYDMFPTAQPQEHRDYKLVYDGIVIDSPDDDVDYTYTLYGDDMVTEDAYQYLHVDQKHDIIATRNLMLAAMAEDIDFTDPMDGRLG